jgi:Tfp pilus assembly protein PilV
MMAAVILVIGFIGMIEAVTLSSGMLDHARRQTLAAQIINHEIEKLRLQSWTAINALPTSSTALGAAYNGGTAYVVGDTATYSGAWYRCTAAGTGQTPSSGSSYWTVDTPPYANAFTTSTSGIALGATYTVQRTATDLVSGSLREITFTVTWTVTTSRLDSFGSPLTFTYTRVNTAYFGKYGLNLTYQRS